MRSRPSACPGPVIAATADARRRVLAAPVLARHRRPVHEISADHVDRDAVGFAGGRAVLHADARRAARQGRAVPHDERAARRRALYAHGAARAAPSWRRRSRSRSFLLIAVQIAYGKFGRGVEFFPKVEPDYRPGHRAWRAAISRLTRRTALVREVEQRVLASEGLKTVYTRIGEQPRGIERTHRRHHRRHPVRVRRLADAAVRA